MSLQRRVLLDGFPEEHRALANQPAGTIRLHVEWSMAALKVIILFLWGGRCHFRELELKPLPQDREAKIFLPEVSLKSNMDNILKGMGGCIKQNNAKTKPIFLRDLTEIV